MVRGLKDALSRIRAQLDNLPPTPQNFDDEPVPGGTYWLQGYYGDNDGRFIYAADLQLVLDAAEELT